jgi:hypothetical protein
MRHSLCECHPERSEGSQLIHAAVRILGGAKGISSRRYFWFRDVDSNHDTQLQRLMSYRLDDPGIDSRIVAEPRNAPKRLLRASFRRYCEEDHATNSAFPGKRTCFSSLRTGSQRVAASSKQGRASFFAARQVFLAVGFQERPQRRQVQFSKPPRFGQFPVCATQRFLLNWLGCLQRRRGGRAV